MPTDAAGSAPEVSAEGRRLIDEMMETWASLTWATRAKIDVVGVDAYTARVDECEAEHDKAEDALLAYVAGLEAAIARGTEDGDVLRAFRAGWQQRGQFDAAQRGRTTEGA